MMLLAVTSLIVPSSFSRFFAPEGTIRQEQLLNIGIAFVLLAVYEPRLANGSGDILQRVERATKHFARLLSDCFGGGTLSSLDGLPLMSGVAARVDTERVGRTIAEVTTLLARRDASAADGRQRSAAHARDPDRPAGLDRASAQAPHRQRQAEGPEVRAGQEDCQDGPVWEVMPVGSCTDYS